MAKFIFEGCLISNAFSLWYWKSLKSFCKRADCQEGGRRGGVKVKLKRCEARPGQKRAHSGTLTRYFISSVREEALIFFWWGGSLARLMLYTRCPNKVGFNATTKWSWLTPAPGSFPFGRQWVPPMETEIPLLFQMFDCTRSLNKSWLPGREGGCKS